VNQLNIYLFVHDFDTSRGVHFGFQVLIDIPWLFYYFFILAVKAFDPAKSEQGAGGQFRDRANSV